MGAKPEVWEAQISQKCRYILKKTGKEETNLKGKLSTD